MRWTSDSRSDRIRRNLKLRYYHVPDHLAPSDGLPNAFIRYAGFDAADEIGGGATHRFDLYDENEDYVGTFKIETEPSDSNSIDDMVVKAPNVRHTTDNEVIMPLPPEGRTYGEWAITVPAIEIQHAHYILGASVLPDKEGNPAFVDVQWRSSDGVQQVRIEWKNALALLTFLKCIQLDAGWPFPLDPRDPNWRAGDGKP